MVLQILPTSYSHVTCKSFRNSNVLHQFWWDWDFPSSFSSVPCLYLLENGSEDCLSYRPLVMLWGRGSRRVWVKIVKSPKLWSQTGEHGLSEKCAFKCCLPLLLAFLISFSLISFFVEWQQQQYLFHKSVVKIKLGLCI